MLFALARIDTPLIMPPVLLRGPLDMLADLVPETGGGGSSGLVDWVSPWYSGFWFDRVGDGPSEE